MTSANSQDMCQPRLSKRVGSAYQWLNTVTVIRQDTRPLCRIVSSEQGHRTHECLLLSTVLTQTVFIMVQFTFAQPAPSDPAATDPLKLTLAKKYSSACELFLDLSQFSCQPQAFLPFERLQCSSLKFDNTFYRAIGSTLRQMATLTILTKIRTIGLSEKLKT
ncbi:unnamed protein product [Nesidiocoris tenuis]|uniref:Uncharacterized protein n=1 Tax=Nesidiocoris tenuis TaxID=355587 RepID=A0A6H5GGY7_9HEMI|nr:unnamed protein product [Nesidiocoris tenuis]